jgi:Methyltransferase domain
VLTADARVANWLEAAEARYLSDLTFSELTRALRALSVRYVERRDTLAAGEALATAGKRAAFALFYGPLHLLTVQAIVRALDAGESPRKTLVDLGCGTGAAGAAWALHSGARIDASDVNPWALAEAQWTFHTLGLRATTRRIGIERVSWPRARADVLAAFVLNELPSATRDLLMLPRVIEAIRHGHRVLIVEPIARRAVPWWPVWAEAIAAEGGRADEWRVRVDLPDIVRRLDRAAGLKHSELTARSLAAGF